MQRAPHPLLVIGLDGASPNVLDHLGERLPNLQRLRHEGLSGIATSTEPPATFPAWTSVLTGCTPEVHGVRDLLTRNHSEAPLRPVSGRERQAPLIPEELARAGHAVACIGVPGLYPPPRAAGLWLSGFDAPGADRASPASVYPPSLHRVLQRMGGWRYATFNEQQVSLADAATSLLEDLEDKARIIRALYRSRRWDLFFVHLQASDTACHHLWPTWDRASPRAHAYPQSEALPEVFERLDRLIGEWVELHGARVLLVSDHGFGGASNVAVHLNRLLVSLGLARFGESSAAHAGFGGAARWTARALPPSLLGTLTQNAPAWLLGRAISASRQAPLTSTSLAFSDELDYAPSIWLRPTVSDATRERLKAALLALRCRSGDAVIRAVRERRGAGAGPDLYLEPAWPKGYRPCFLPSDGPGPVVRQLNDEELRGGRGMGMPGVHHPDGVVALWGPGIESGTVRASLAEIGASLPSLMGLPHIHVSGRAEPTLSEAAGLDISQRRQGHGETPTERPKVSAAVTRRLRALGYL